MAEHSTPHEERREALIRRLQHEEMVEGELPSSKTRRRTFLFFLVFSLVASVVVVTVCLRFAGPAALPLIVVFLLLYGTIGGLAAWVTGMMRIREDRDIKRRVDAMLREESAPDI